MYYERSRYYNPILYLKAAAAAGKNDRVVTPHRMNGPTWIWLGVKRVIARFSKISASNVIVRKDLTKMKNPLQVFATQLEFATVAGDSIKKSNSQHECDIIFCKTCFSLLLANHSFFMQPF